MMWPLLIHFSMVIAGLVLGEKDTIITYVLEKVDGLSIAFFFTRYTTGTVISFACFSLLANTRQPLLYLK